MVKKTTSSYSAGTFNSSGVDCSWSQKKFKSGFSIKVNKLDNEMIEFDMIGADPSIANAFRRIMISEVPTVAIEHVFYVNNTSVIAVRRALQIFFMRKGCPKK